MFMRIWLLETAKNGLTKIRSGRAICIQLRGGNSRRAFLKNLICSSALLASYETIVIIF